MTKELLQDLLEQANDTAQTDSLRAAEAAYQLAVAHFEGIGMIKDIENGFHWLENAAFRGSKKAISGFANILASMGRVMTPQLEELTLKQLPALAKAELHMSFRHSFNNTITHSDTFIALRKWVNQHPDAYKDYVTSSVFGLLKPVFLSIHVAEGGGAHTDVPFEFQVLDDYDPYSFEMFKASEKNQFIKSICSHKCLDRTDNGYLTLLQVAAARGDLESAKTLVADLGAKVDAVGLTPGLTPLWISCFTGNIEIACFLVERGASPLCKDKSGRTILHFLNKCNNINDLTSLFKTALQGGLNIEKRDSDGNTPLLSTFIGWDFSQGLAARFLLGLNANVWVKPLDWWTPFTAAIRSLDLNLIIEMSSGFQGSFLQNASASQVLDLSIEEAKSAAFNYFGIQSEFYRRRLGGAAASEKLQGIVDLIIDLAMLITYKSKFKRGFNPLISACHMR